MTSFEIIGDISDIETIAAGHKIREVVRLKKLYGPGRWRKRKGIAIIRLANGQTRRAELHGMKRTASAEKNLNESDIWIKSMTIRKQSSRRFAVCVDNSEYPASLEIHKLYRVLSDKDAEREGDLRIVDESGEDYLYPADYFVLVEFPADTARALKKSFASGLQHTR